ncbi:tRNA-splicing endonuclease subunit Sen2 [Zea mays]|uniref:tRNA-intron lyase n=1 Tax=Zea mays TaxID=4577 RepID=B6T9E3_MAIZE|nr:tRNA-splicing endonuclease subunit Sen2 [Zea mays]ACG33726.1 tRNA-splicing endonuclease subunit Sen2 [Zea mays]ACR34187.1 unknown [Zea mays]AQK67323.1 tRNA-splicing endonuclease subunit Sen2-2 [Zea mays]|eukprot:NP_001148986.1 tRNA-splicing endonuclease subunit Sen2 [Zea mays]
MKGGKSNAAGRSLGEETPTEDCGADTMQRKLMDLPGPRWKKGKDCKGFAALAAANPMSSIVAELQASLRDSEAVAILAAHARDAILEVGPRQAALLNGAAFGRAVEGAGAESQWFQLGPEEVFFLCHALKCLRVESNNKTRIGAPELWGLLASGSEQFPEMYRAYQYLRLKNWVVRSGLQYGADFVAYRHHPALVHSEFTVVVAPEGKAFGTRCARMEVWSEVLCALRASGSVAKTLLVLTISTKSCELGSLDCLEQMIVHERTITRWIPQQCSEQQDKPCREETNRDGQRQKSCIEVSSNEEQEHTSGGVVFSYWPVVLSYTILFSVLVYKLKS